MNEGKIDVFEILIESIFYGFLWSLLVPLFGWIPSIIFFIIDESMDVTNFIYSWAGYIGILFFICLTIFVTKFINRLEEKERIEANKKVLGEEKKKREKYAKKQREKGLELFDGKWVKKEEIPRLKEIKYDLDNNFENFSPYEFEKFISKLFNAMGYKTEITQQTGDYGVDVMAYKNNDSIAIQVKKHREGNPVGNRDVQRILGAMQHRKFRANHGLLITTSHFTVQARDQAEECAIELWDKKDLHKMVRKYLMKIDEDKSNEIELYDDRLTPNKKIFEETLKKLIERSDTNSVSSPMATFFDENTNDFVNFQLTGGLILSNMSEVASPIGGKDLERIKQILRSFGFSESKIKNPFGGPYENLKFKEFWEGKLNKDYPEFYANFGEDTELASVTTDKIFRGVYELPEDYKIKTNLYLKGF